ncbi:MAG TPA: trehalose-phosphatase [Thermoanaerobaculia bacterium]|nr:trehalose-phosphatase [Thermoanaerobaculia bacterium]
MTALPSALAHWPELARRLAGRRPVVFLDFDGTLAPIVERPEEAGMPEPTRRAVERLAARVPVAVVSGRRREDVAAKVGMPGLVYAGSHGFDLGGPGFAEEVAPELPPLVERVAAGLAEELANVPGVEVEPKRWTAAVHYRRAAAADVPRVRTAVERAAAAHPELVVAGGKKVFEVRPALAWDKGRAVLHLLARLGLDGPAALPVYLGDDVTDEDAFRALAERPGGGVGVRVADEPADSAAQYSLASPAEVPELLDRIADAVD